MDDNTSSRFLIVPIIFSQTLELLIEIFYKRVDRFLDKQKNVATAARFFYGHIINCAHSHRKNAHLCNK